MATFPIASLVGKEDSAKYGFEVEDVGIRSEMEGGYIITRPRHTRNPRRTWATGFTDVSNADKLLLEAFFNDHGTFKAFTYTVPVPNISGGAKETVNARFMGKMEFKYVGYGANARWNIDVKIEEV
jgi:phage-related protein